MQLEYRVVEVGTHSMEATKRGEVPMHQRLESMLNELGRDGWSYCGQFDHRVVYKPGCLDALMGKKSYTRTVTYIVLSRSV